MEPERWQAIEKLYHAARELPPAERALLLAQACPADDSLRHEVEVLLQCDGAEWGFIDGRAIEFTAQRLAAAELNEVKPTLTGQQIGAYKILGPLGKGGMGEVYRAKDARLNREVAIKVLPSSFVKDENRLKRFEREARATSALNHPNILTVHDIGQHQGAPYIVAELLEGQELRGALKQGALPLRKVLDYARQITAGLTAAHAKGIVHRDLKPENLFVTNDGRIKILDFGLAKLKPLQFESSASLLSPAPKPLVNLTDSGMLMGTVAYMSPEQMRGEAVDQRSDIFSFGLILYEMLCGGRAFQRDTMAETMAAILKDDPPELSESNPRISPQLEKLVQHCLEKEPERRFQAASDLGFALDALATQSSSGANQADNVPRLASRATGWRARLWPIAAAGFALLALAFALAYLWRPMLEAEPMRFSVNPPEKATFFDWPTISPDGRTLVFVAEVNGKTQLWVRTLGSMTARPLVEVNDSLPLPFWSPNNQFIAYFDGLKLKKIGLAGGAPEILCAVQQQGGGAWNRDGVILFGGMATGIKRISANGGDIAPVTSIDTARGDAVHLAPVFLPDGRHFLYFINNSDPAKNGIYLSSLAGGESKRLLSVDARTVAVAVNPADPRTGYVTFVRQGALLAQPFDFNQNQLVGEPTRIAEQIAAPVGRWARYSMATYGTVILREKEADEQLTWFDRTGKKLGVVGPPGRYTYPRISPDGKNLAVTMIKPPALQGDIYLFDLVGGAGIPFTFDPLQDEFPLWSPDGSQISWDSTREGTTNFFQKAARGTGQDEILLRSAYHKYLTDWSSDGRFILYRELNPQTSWDLWVMPLTGTQQPWPWLNTPASEVRATFSPDGQWIAYNSNESGRNEIYLQAFVPGAPASGGKRQLSTNGGGIPFWRHDGRELYYLAKDKLMAVEITPGADLKYRMAQELFAPSGFQWNADRGYASAGDGQRFLFVTSAEDNSLPPFTVVLNWMAEMKK